MSNIVRPPKAALADRAKFAMQIAALESQIRELRGPQPAPAPPRPPASTGEGQPMTSPVPASRPALVCPRCRQPVSPMPGISVWADPAAASPLALFECPEHGLFHTRPPGAR